jgi:hypothetical protein
MSSFARRTLLWLASQAVKAQDKLAALGLDRPPGPAKRNTYPAKENMDMNLPNHKMP